MKGTLSQLPLNLNLNQDKTFSGYYAKGNEELVAALHKAACGRGEFFIYYWGHSCLGRSHLLHACCHNATQLKLLNLCLPLSQIDHFKTDMLDNLESMSLVCVDDLQYIAKKPEWEEAFFDFYHRMTEAKKRLIISANLPPQHLGLDLADLTSRLNSGLTFQIHELTDEEKLDALVFRAQSQGLMMPPEAAKFILHRYPRDLGFLFDAMDKLDRASLAAQRRLTIPFIKEVLG